MIAGLRRRWRAARVERAFVRGGRGWARSTLAAHRRRLAADARARAQHEGLHAPWRTLASDGVSPFELDEVGAWLAEEFGASAASAVTTRSNGYVWGTVFAGVTLALLLSAWWVASTAAGPNRFDTGVMVADASGVTSRGDAHGGGLGLEVLCGPELHFARPQGCRLDEELTFAFRLAPAFDASADPPGRGGQLVLFGIDAAGDTLYYAPTPEPADPVPAALADVRGAGWIGTGFGVRLDVNHEPGRLRVYGLWTGAAVSVDDVDAWAEQLRRYHALGEPGPAARWTKAAGLVGSPACPTEEACADAWVDLNLTAAGAHAGPAPGE